MSHAVRTLLFTPVLLQLLSGPSQGHRINVFAYVEGGRVHTESYFADGRPVKQSRILVYDSADRLLYEGTTDDDGLHSFPVPKIDDLRIVVREVLGHRNSFTLRKADVEAAMPAEGERN